MPPWTSSPRPELPQAPGLLWCTRAQARAGRAAAIKLKLKGKSLKWVRRSAGLQFRGGLSHPAHNAVPPLTALGLRAKTRMAVTYSGSTYAGPALAWAREFCAWRRPNTYHARGLRLGRQRLGRKAGKVSAYR